MCIYIYIYITIERERERTNKKNDSLRPVRLQPDRTEVTAHLGSRLQTTAPGIRRFESRNFPCETLDCETETERSFNSTWSWRVHSRRVVFVPPQAPARRRTPPHAPEPPHTHARAHPPHIPARPSGLSAPGPGRRCRTRSGHLGLGSHRFPGSAMIEMFESELCNSSPSGSGLLARMS